MVYTDFTKYSHAQLRTMAQALDPGAVMAAGDPWRTASDTLKQIRLTLTKASTEAATTWEGTTSDAFHTRMLNLAASINNAAAYANDAANILHSVSEAMAKAKREMPEEPGNWDKFKDTVGDGVSAVFGDGDDDHIPIADRKKAEAAAIMQTLAMHYRIATPALKAPPPYDPKKPPAPKDDRADGPQDDPIGAAATAAAIFSGTSAGASTRGTSVPPPQRSRSSQTPVQARSTARNMPVPTDSGIKGGTAQASLKPPGSLSRGPAEGISGRPVSPSSGSVPSPVLAGTQTSGIDVAPTGSPAGGPFGGGQENGRPAGSNATPAPAGPVVGQAKVSPGGKEVPSRATPVEGSGPRIGRVVGGEVQPGLGAGSRGVPGGKQPARTSARPGVVAGENVKPVPGAQGRQSFTEGGSGLGARNRLKSEPGVGSTNAISSGVPLSGAQGRKKDREKDGKRPDFLVEDEETWASDKPANPNVVE
ncbi:hypothetical protein GCM10018790_44360 [Kitasatospora xanthocidica]|uniref:WXG100 family type VII secretion target n=1 Tax=Kitasatospora xanthocidica TaxID=83382 RepID=UPI00167896A6|nr:hypothetical protein [Kitasatospora xanthocidica]GHF61573.1 hypothetical protein GCM10018790_44360 [Kitasatospora xanthocidica]